MAPLSPRWRRRWTSWHLTLGALLAPYAIVYGVSALLYSHPSWAPARPRTWTETVSVPQAASPEARAVAARDALGLVGTVPPWRIESSPEGDLAFRVVRPGRVYDIRWEPTRGEATVRVKDSRLLGVVRDLHGRTHIPGSLWGPIWSGYTLLSLVGFPLLFASGVLLEWPRWRRRPGWGIAATGALALLLALAGWLAA